MFNLLKWEDCSAELLKSQDVTSAPCRCHAGASVNIMESEFKLANMGVIRREKTVFADEPTVLFVKRRMGGC